MVVGITGSSGSGKSAVARIFAENGFSHIDLDAVSRNVATVNSPCLDEIVSTFGDGILNPDGSLNRRALGEIVFKDETKLTTLTEITHKYILKEMNTIIANTDGDILLDAPLLFEADVDKQCDFCIGVISERKTQIQRIASRDGISEETAAARLDKQHSNEFFMENCDYFIENNGTEAELSSKAEALIRTLREEVGHA